ncbi:fibronectin type III domain-containing protein [Anoxybacillus sp. LAT_35]|uniref:fibronectin type III domain-containing protein n=1 Tax=unclassified Anoxybacillus TaxID=2639704 RepID=UPI001EDB4517|nr:MULTISPECIES: fibronectin type III domain-containing protein [unclassified Anoxybacillus]MCG5024627.1 fibronectin type III domain-containing protein [Anoxybacillus flavithermus]MCG6172688.1 fibronectin type III domain-containing protein [Anoxybacillus sp. LAT_11]MCG6173324.1 fibronectin type III domain-containing protein [Anoxybacillus sp. LAT_11]MCG6176468.1 fibronectin type III domain-containing protein [Anoxybacillus sp. LAT_35]MCG6180424.1 fibronectin type III domain-containing protein 
MDNVRLNIGYYFGDYGGYTPYVTDNNLSTYSILSKKDVSTDTIFYTFQNSVDISGFRIKTDTNINIYFYDSTGRIIYRSGEFIGDGSFISLEYNIKSFAIYNFANEVNKVYEFNLYSEDIIPPADVTNLQASEIGEEYVTLTWNEPEDVDFSHYQIYQNGYLISENYTYTSITIQNLNPNTDYNFMVVSVDNKGNKSSGQSVMVTTLVPIVGDITDLQADAKYDHVKLTWTPPDSEFFHHVKIYRKKVEQQSFWDQLFGTTAVSAETTSDGYTPMFETNGTYWTDLTVTPETTYSYKVTSVNIEGNESQGVTIETTTPSEPVPVLAGVATTQNENGDYIVTWTSPTKGTVKLLIEGREYAQVDAATKQIVVRKEDMKTDFFGAYAATLIPIGEYGTKGQAVSVPSLGEKIDFPLSFQDFMETVVSILAWVAPFIVLSLVFIFWRPIFNFIKKAISERRVKQ